MRLHEFIQNLAKAWMRSRNWRIRKIIQHPHAVQKNVFQTLIQKAQNTVFGKKYRFRHIKTPDQFRQQVPISSYETFYSYIERVLSGEANVLWPGKVNWFAKSSGTTNDKSKFIPMTYDCLHYCHYRAGKDMMAWYLHLYPDSKLFAGKVLSIGGSHQISRFNQNARYGDLSAVLIQNMPSFYEAFRAPSRKTALLADFEQKIEIMARECLSNPKSIVAIAGVPTWTMVLIERMLQITGKNDLLEVLPNLEVFFHGAVSFTPYRSQFAQLIGANRKMIRYIEIYNASEGYFGLQIEPQTCDMLLMLDHGIFYEFILLDELIAKGIENATAVGLENVTVNQTYAMVISVNSGLWRYLIGDTVRFTSTNPYRIVITGRTKHFINAFGEEVVIENAESAILMAARQTQTTVIDYTAGPIFLEIGKKGAHEWIIECQEPPANKAAFITVLDQHLQQINSDYEAKRYNNLALHPPVVHFVEKGTFYQWMKLRGKLGGQNKVPRLSNDRQYLDSILEMLKKNN